LDHGRSFVAPADESSYLAQYLTLIQRDIVKTEGPHCRTWASKPRMDDKRNRYSLEAKVNTILKVCQNMM
jgi:hypothetical protein